MKSKRYTILILILVMVLLPPTTTVSAQNEKTYFTFTETCDLGSIQIMREIMNGQANYQAKHLTQTCYETGSVPEVTGTVTIDINLNLVGNGTVGLWVGKAYFVTAEGAWDMNCIYPWPSDDAQCVGKGQGAYEGLQIFTKGYPGEAWAGYIIQH